MASWDSDSCPLFYMMPGSQLIGFSSRHLPCPAHCSQLCSLCCFSGSSLCVIGLSGHRLLSKVLSSGSGPGAMESDRRAFQSDLDQAA